MVLRPNPPGHSTASSAILGFEAQTEKPSTLVVLRPKLPNPPGRPAAPGATPGFEAQTRKPSWPSGRTGRHSRFWGPNLETLRAAQPHRAPRPSFEAQIDRK